MSLLESISRLDSLPIASLGVRGVVNELAVMPIGRFHIHIQAESDFKILEIDLMTYCQ